MVIVDRIRIAANYRGVKLGKLCELLGEKSNYLGKVERGLRRMDEDQIHRIADFLNVDFDYLTGESEFMNSDIISEENKTGIFGYGPVSRGGSPVFNYDRYNERRIARHLTPDYTTSQLRLPDDYWEDVRDGFATPDRQTVIKLAVLLNTTYEYLMGLTGNPEIPSDDRTGVKIKVFGEVAAGIPIQQIDNFDPEDADSWEEIDRRTAKSGTYFALRIKGDSMEPRIRDGDRVIVRVQESVESGQTAVIAINGDTATCKKVFYDAQNGMTLVSNNSQYPPRYFTSDQIRSIPVRVLGLVVEIRGLP